MQARGAAERDGVRAWSGSETGLNALMEAISRQVGDGATIPRATLRDTARDPGMCV